MSKNSNNKALMRLFLLFIGFGLVLTNCTEPYTPDTLESDQQYVVEGYVEAGDGALPTYVIITRSIPFVSEISQSTFEGLFVDNAVVTVNDGDKDVELTKICTNDDNLPPVIKQAVADFLGVSLNQMGPNICVYLDFAFSITREIGRTYDLKIEIGDEIITGSTSIVRHVPLSNFRWDDPPGEPNDTLARLWVTVEDPEGEDYYRYQTGINDRGLIAQFQSTTNDAFFDGQEFEFPLNKAEYPEDNTEFNEFGLYPRGDTVLIKWMNIDRAHFDFWNTRDFSANSGGPFASYTRIAGNLDGALGIWGGYSISQYLLPIPE